LIEVKLTTVAKEAPSNHLIPSTVYDISNALLDNEITIDKRVEFGGVFKMSVSNFDLSFKDSGEAVFDLFNLTTLELYYLGIQLIVDGVPEFWGYVNPESVDRDEISGDIITCTVVNWSKVFEDYETATIPALATYDISHFFTAILGEAFLPGVDVYVGTLMQTFDITDYNSLRSNGMTVKDFVFELQKNYGAFIYFSPDKRLKFINRGSNINGSSINISNDIVEEEDNSSKEFRTSELVLNKYNAILANVQGNWSLSGGSWVFYEGWALAQWDGFDYVVTTGINESLSNIPKGVNYLDIRQDLTWNGNSFGKSFIHVLFADRDAGDRFEDYKTVLRKCRKRVCTVNRTDIDLFYQVNFGTGKDYIVLNAGKKIKAGTIELELLELPS
jgi:hypothetical protein